MPERRQFSLHGFLKNPIIAALMMTWLLCPGAYSAQAPKPDEVINRYLYNLKKIERCHIKFKSVQKSDTNMPGVPAKSGKWTTYNEGEIFSDGTRYHIFNRQWGNTLSPHEFVPEDKKGLTSYLFDGSRFASYGVSPLSAITHGIANITEKGQFGYEPAVTGVLLGNATSLLQGNVGERYEQIGQLLLKSQTTAREIKTPTMKGILLEAKTKYGEYAVLFDLERGYNIIRAEVNIAGGDTLANTVLSPDVSMRHMLHNVRLELINNIWMPMEADYSATRKYSRNSWSNGDVHIVQTEVTLNPDFEKLNAFVPNEIQEWAVVFYSGQPDTRYIWQSGKPVKSIDRRLEQWNENLQSRGVKLDR